MSPKLTTVTQEPPKNPKRVEAGKKGGRPATRRAANRTVNVQFRLSSEEKEALQTAADDLGYTLGDCIINSITHLINPELPGDPQDHLAVTIGLVPTLLSKQDAKVLLKQLTEKLLN